MYPHQHERRAKMSAYLLEHECLEMMKGIGEQNANHEESIATPAEASASEPTSVTFTRNSSCTQPLEKAAEGLFAAHYETPPSPLAPSCQDCSPLQGFIFGVVGDLTLNDIVQDNAKGIRQRKNSSGHLEAIQEVGWKWGCSKVSDSVVMEDPTEEDDDDDLMDPEDEDLVRQIALRFDSAGRLAAMAPKIPERRTSYEIPQRRTSFDEAANANDACSIEMAP